MCKGFGWHFPAKTENLNHQHCIKCIHFLQPSYASGTFRPRTLVRGHGRLRPLHPGQPWPRGASRQPTHGRPRLRSAAVSSLTSRGPRPTSRTQWNEEKISEKCWVPQKSKFGKLSSLKLPVNLRNIVVLKSSSWLKRMLLSVQYPLVFRWRHISHVASQGDFYKSNILQL